MCVRTAAGKVIPPIYIRRAFQTRKLLFSFWLYGLSKNSSEPASLRMNRMTSKILAVCDRIVTLSVLCKIRTDRKSALYFYTFAWG